jgi:hypothetical protein
VLFVAGLFLMLAGTFLTITSTTVGSHRARQLALGQQPPKALGSLTREVKVKRCGICGENIPTSTFYDPIKPHVESVHPEYSRLFKQFRKVLLASGATGSVFLVVADYSAVTTRNDLLLIGANGAFVLAMIILVSTYSMKLLHTKRRWKREHHQYTSTP